MTTLPLRTQRFVISPLTAADRDAFVAYRDNPDIARYQGWELPYTPADGDALLAKQPNTFPPPAGGWLQLAIHPAPSTSTTQPPDPQLLGDVAVHTHPTTPNTYELGVTVSPAAQGRGVGTECLSAVRGALLVLGAERVIASCDSRNAAVKRVLGKAGFRLEEEEEEEWRGERIVMETWACLR